MAIFGYNTIGTGGQDNPADNVCWMKAASLPASSGTLMTISIYCNIRTGTPQINCALYTDSAGVPGTLIASGTAQTVPASLAWVDVPISAAIAASTQYWFAMLVPGGGGTADAWVELDDPGAVNEFYFHSNGGPPGASTFLADGTGATLVTHERCSVYGTYTVSAVDSGIKTRRPNRPGPFKPMGDGFRTGKYGGWR